MMPRNDHAGGPSGVDPRAAALSRYLRRTAAFFSMSADATDSASTADVGMALLDAARIAEAMPSTDPRIRVLSEANLFESMPEDEAVFVEVAEIRRALRRTLVSGPQDGPSIIAQLIKAAGGLSGLPEPPAPRPHTPGRGRQLPDWALEQARSDLFDVDDDAAVRVRAWEILDAAEQRDDEQHDEYDDPDLGGEA